MEITKEQRIALLEALGFKNVSKWSEARIADKIARLADSVDDDIKITDKKLAALFKRVLAAKGDVTVKGVPAKKGKPAPVVDDEEDEESEDDESEDEEDEDDEDEDEEDEDDESEDEEDEDEEDEDDEDEAPPPPVKKGKAKAPAKKAKPAPVEDEDDEEAPPSTKEKDPAKVARGKALAASRLAGSVKDAYGNNPESQAGAINAIICALKKPKKGPVEFAVDQIVEASKLSKGRVKNHLKYLVEKGHIKQTEHGWQRVK